MDAEIVYEVSQVPHPFSDARRKAGVTAFCLLKVTRPIVGDEHREPVAIFNLDSEADEFVAHVVLAGLAGKLIEVPRAKAESIRRVAKLERSSRQARKVGA